jgi:hypothetical protein
MAMVSSQFCEDRCAILAKGRFRQGGADGRCRIILSMLWREIISFHLSGKAILARPSGK